MSLKVCSSDHGQQMNWCFFYEQYILINMSVHDKCHLHDRKKTTLLYRTKMQWNNKNKYSRKDEQQMRR